MSAFVKYARPAGDFRAGSDKVSDMAAFYKRTLPSPKPQAHLEASLLDAEVSELKLDLKLVLKQQSSGELDLDAELLAMQAVTPEPDHVGTPVGITEEDAREGERQDYTPTPHRVSVPPIVGLKELNNSVPSSQPEDSAIYALIQAQLEEAVASDRQAVQELIKLRER